MPPKTFMVCGKVQKVMVCAGNAFSLVTESLGWLSSSACSLQCGWVACGSRAAQVKCHHISHSTDIKMNQLLPAWEQHRVARVLPCGSQHCHTSRVFAVVFSWKDPLYDQVANWDFAWTVVNPDVSDSAPSILTTHAFHPLRNWSHLMHFEAFLVQSSDI